MEDFLELYGCDCYYCRRRVADKNSFNPFIAGIECYIKADHEYHKQIHQKRWIVGYLGIDGSSVKGSIGDYNYTINGRIYDSDYCEHPICLIAYDKGSLPLYWRKKLC
jgi:hypothetical protein